MAAMLEGPLEPHNVLLVLRIRLIQLHQDLYAYLLLYSTSNNNRYSHRGGLACASHFTVRSSNSAWVYSQVLRL